MVRKELITDPSFNLAEWYLEKINTEGYYDALYDKEMSRLQSAIMENYGINLVKQPNSKIP